MDTGIVVSILGVVVTALGALFVALAYLEYSKLRQLRNELQIYKQEIAQEHYLAQKANHKIIASYYAHGIEQKIPLLKMAVAIHPNAFNGYNALGYAYRENGEPQKAIDAFLQAIHHHPQEIEGYFDLAATYLEMGEINLCLDYLTKAVKIDPSARDNLQDNFQFKPLADNPRFQRLQLHY